MTTDYVASGDVRIYDVRAILADDCSTMTLNRVIMIIKSTRPSINFIALPLLHNLLVGNFSAKKINRVIMSIMWFCMKAYQ